MNYTMKKEMNEILIKVWNQRLNLILMDVYVSENEEVGEDILKVFNDIEEIFVELKEVNRFIVFVNFIIHDLLS